MSRPTTSLLFVSMAAALAGCPSVTSEPPPLARSSEIPVAPPGARGALAAGTDAAPRPDVSPGQEDEGAAPPGAAPSGAAPPPAPSPSGEAPEGAAPIKPAPDAGTAL